MANSNKENIDNYFSNDYKFLLKNTRGILNKKKKDMELAPTLITNAYLHFTKNDHLYVEVGFQGRVRKWIEMQIKWTNTPFNNKWVYEDDRIIQLLPVHQLIDEYKCEEELLEEEHEIEQSIGILFFIVNNLPIHKKILFELVYQQGIDNSGKLSRYLNIPRSSAYTLIRSLKEEIKTKYEEQYNYIYGRENN